MKDRSRRALLFLFILSLGAAIMWVMTLTVKSQGMQTLHVQSQQQLSRFASHLQGQLDRYNFLPRLLATNQLLAQGLREPDNAARIEVINRYLEEVNGITGASDTYLMDRNGLTIAASNWQSERPFIGRNFGFRPYFQKALEGGEGHYFALGTTSRQRGYYFAYPVRHAAEIIGVVVLKMDLTDIEQRWSGREEIYLVTDEDGVVFISTEPSWQFMTLHELDPMTKGRVINSRRYPGQVFRSLSLGDGKPEEGGGQVYDLQHAPNVQGRYLSLVQGMPEAGWSVRILSPTGGVLQQERTAQVVLGLSLLLFMALFMLGLQRHKRRMDRERIKVEAMQVLEARVSERTKALTHEIEERQRTERVLRETQDELIQSAKLAVLGQMSASISHELNNPLAAIRGYADNARTFLERQQIGPVDDNLKSIGDLTDRMARVSSQLKVFARKSTGQLDAVSLKPVMHAAHEIVAMKKQGHGLKIDNKLPEDGLLVRCNSIQLEQVLINLITNAMQALQDVDAGLIRIWTDNDKEQVRIYVEDNGPGIDDELLETIFEPFVTTREKGLGLGLAISQRIVESMQGRLTVENRPDGGARFTVQLQAVSV